MSAEHAPARGTCISHVSRDEPEELQKWSLQADGLQKILCEHGYWPNGRRTGNCGYLERPWLGHGPRGPNPSYAGGQRTSREHSDTKSVCFPVLSSGHNATQHAKQLHSMHKVHTQHVDRGGRLTAEPQQRSPTVARGILAHRVLHGNHCIRSAADRAHRTLGRSV